MVSVVLAPQWVCLCVGCTTRQMATEALVMCKISYSAVRAGYMLREPPAPRIMHDDDVCKRKKKKKYTT